LRCAPARAKLGVARLGEFEMRRLLPLAAVVATLVVMPARAEVWSVYGINGNDTGGIIPWSPALCAFG